MMRIATVAAAVNISIAGFAPMSEAQSATSNTGLTSSLVAAQSASAATGADMSQDETRIEEVIVSAQKREQSLIDVPISMTALGGVELEELRVQGLDDFAMVVPNLTFSKLGRFGGGGGNINLRGLTTFSGGLFQSTAVTVDELGYGVTDGISILSARFLDIERVEVMRGPQGTLSGRNSMGGAVNLITVKPSTEAVTFDGTLDIGRYSTTLAKLSGNIPISDTLATRIVLYKEDSDGAVKNAYDGRTSFTDNIGGSIAVRWQPNERLTADLYYAYEDQDYGLNNSLQIDVANSDSERQQAIERLALWGSDFHTTQFFDDRGVGNNGGTVYKDTAEGKSLSNQLASVRISYDLGAHQLLLLGGLYDYEDSTIYDYDSTEYALYRGRYDKYQESKTGELRISSSYDGAFNWVAGLSFLSEDFRYPHFDEAGMWLQEGNPWVWAAPPYAIPAVGTENTGWRGVYRTETLRGIESSGVYANVFWDITDRWHLSTGARLTRDKTDFGYREAWDGITYNPVLSGDYETRKGAENQFSHRLALTYDFSESANVYLQWATGYRPGYANDGLPVIAVGAPSMVDPEHVSNYEIGTKGLLFDGRFSYSLALFHMDYKDLQVATSVPNPNPDNWVTEEFWFDVNAGSATIQGVEAEFSAKLTRDLELSGGVGYNDGKIDEVTLSGVTYHDIDIPGRRALTANASASYTRDLTSTLAGRVRLDYSYQDERIDAVDPRIDQINPAFRLLNISAGVFTDRWSLTAYFENVLNERFWNDMYIGNYPFRGAYVDFDPRMYGARFTYHFGPGRR